MNLRPSGYEPDELPDCSTPDPQEAHTADYIQAEAANFDRWVDGMRKLRRTLREGSSRSCSPC